jgi:hypothetical protein
MIEVATQLASSDAAFHTSPMPLVPYPKQGSEVRHYVMPTVRDQFAHLVFAVLLAPFIEAHLPNIAFGNRWYRGIRRAYPSEGMSKGAWQKLPFSLSDDQLFNPYKRDHGLFRRLAAWTAEQFTKERFDTPLSWDTEDHPTKEDYPPTMLPYIGEAFPLVEATDNTLCYARLDLTKAFPSFHRRDVRRSLLTLLSTTETCDTPEKLVRWGLEVGWDRNDPWSSILGPISSSTPLENPWRSLAGDEGRPIRLELANRWCDLLDKATYETQGHNFDLTMVMPVQFFDDQQQHSNSFGLPTGLAVSPMLLNVLLHRLDMAVINHLESTSINDALNGAYIRFADDMIAFGTSEAALRSLLSTIINTLKSFEAYGPELYPRLNARKARPEAIGKWLDTGDLDTPIELNRSDFIGEDNKAEFVTNVVQRMSILSQETILERHGINSFERLAQLHELARWDIQDVEVRKDTRLAFSVNKLVRAWFPNDRPKESLHAAEEIRRTVRKAILEAPWKYSLWRSAIKAALRVNPETGKPIDSGLAWLERQLSQISIGGSWSKEWPQEDCPKEPLRTAFQEQTEYDLAHSMWQAWHDREVQGGLREMRLSFLRANFWRSYAQIVYQLSIARARVSESKDLPSKAWYTSVIGHEGIEATLHALLDTERWGAILYGSTSHIVLPPWEDEAVKIAITACMGASSDSSTTKNQFVVLHPTLSRLSGFDLFEHILDGFHKVGNLAIQDADIRGKIALLATYAGGISDGRTLRITLEQAFTTFTYEWQGAYPVRLQEPANFMCALSFYKNLRSVLWSYKVSQSWLKRLTRIVLSTPNPAPNGTPLYEVLWRTHKSIVSNKKDVDPTRVPTLGLCTPWSLKIHGDLVADVSLDSSLPLEAQLNDNWAEFVLQERASILGENYPQRPDRVAPFIKEPSVAHWGLPKEYPPHPVSFLPGWLGWDTERSQHWHAAIALGFAMTGDESFHERLWRSPLNSIPWSDNLALRCKMLLPSFTWKLIDFATGWPVSHSSKLVAEHHLKTVSAGSRLMSAGAEELVISVQIDGHFPVIDMSEFLVHPNETPPLVIEGETIVSKLIPASPFKPTRLKKNLKVRLAQLSAKPLWEKQAIQWPHLANVCEPMRKQVDQALQGLSVVPSSGQPQIIAFPELAIHPDEATDVARLAAKHKVGLLSGLYWRALPPAVRPAHPQTRGHYRYLVNEAILSVPHFQGPNHYLPYTFYIRKPRPAHIEYGVQAALSDHKGTPGKWRILAGQEWLRFLHPNWGPFVVAICSDLLDIGPWARLKGHILHVMLVAWNDDVALYDAMTWTRAYELFSNVAAVNHGERGGSLAWTPKRDHDKTLFSVKGAKQFVTADVVLPVAALAAEQKRDPRKLLADKKRDASEMLGLVPKTQKKSKDKFKAPPVHFQRHW